MKSPHKIVFLVPYPLQRAPSQRFRVEAFLPVMEEAGLRFSVHPFMDQTTWNKLYRKGAYFSKAWGLFKGFCKRWLLVLFKIHRYEYVFIHREAAPAGPPIFEWIIAKMLRKKIIYDFDDAIWIPNTSSANRFAGWFKASWKVKYICKWAHKVAVGNDYLCRYAGRFNKNVNVIPTSIQLPQGHYEIKKSEKRKLSIGWTGSHSTLKYLDAVVPVINELQKHLEFDFLVIADRNPALRLKNYRFIPWNVSTENDDLHQLDIGIMPLVMDAWSEGKCGFKLIQYFANGIPAVASPVGVNKVIIENGSNGFLCYTDRDWKNALEKLLTNDSLRERMGAAGRQKIASEYSIPSQAEKFIALFTG